MAKAQKTVIGRPPVDPADKRDKPVKAMVTASEQEELQAAASAEQRTISDWLRLIALDAARAKKRRS